MVIRVAVASVILLLAACGVAVPDSSARLADYVKHAEETGDVLSAQKDWMAAVRALRDDGVITTGMMIADLEAMLGAPTDRGDDWAEWIFPSGGLVNPGVVASVEGGVVTGLTESIK